MIRCVVTTIVLLPLALLCAASAADKPIVLGPGPQLFLDDYLIAKSDNVVRKVVQPKRHLKEPILTSAQGHQNWQPWGTVIHDPTRPPESRFRIWYNADTVDDPREGAFGPVLGYLESADGVHWPQEYKVMPGLNVQAGGSVIDEGPDFAKRDERYKVINYSSGSAGIGAGPVVAFSPDGLQWSMHNRGQPVLDKPMDDSWHATYDPIRKRYLLIGKILDVYAWTNAEGRFVGATIRRFGVSFSNDFRTWSPLKVVFTPDDKDPGYTQWYAAVGFMQRGDMILAFLQVLRDDLTTDGAPKEAVDCNLGNPGAGMGHTVLAWTRDGGETWQRDRQKDAYLEPDPTVGAWDHAMAWVASSVPVGDEVYLYYSGFRWGHKYRRSEDRQFGLIKTKRDRYVARQAGPTGGEMTTPPVTLNAGVLTLNADVATGGEVRVQVLDAADENPLSGFGFADCRPITGDVLSAPVQWNGKSLSDLRGRAVRLQFSIKNASLYALELTN